jgi:hypothetical protein
MNIREMPWFERPGARLKRSGPEVLSDAELLAVVLGRGSKEENVIDCSRRVLHEANLNYLADGEVLALGDAFSYLNWRHTLANHYVLEQWTLFGDPTLQIGGYR